MSTTRLKTRLEEVKLNSHEFQQKVNDQTLIDTYRAEGQDPERILQGDYHVKAFKPELARSLSSSNESLFGSPTVLRLNADLDLSIQPTSPTTLRLSPLK